MLISITKEHVVYVINIEELTSHKDKSSSQRVRARAQLGENALTPKEFFVEEELHLATIPFVGKFTNNSLFIH